MKYKLLTGLGLFVILSANAQEKNFTRQDSLRGSITPERAWWDLVHYDLDVKVDPEKQYLEGSNVVTYKVLKVQDRLQIDLQKPMQLTHATQNGKELEITDEGSAHFIQLKDKQALNSIQKLTLKFKGTPRNAKNPPWDGGWTWQEDSNGNTFAANANQGIGASVWWPNKDHPYDEVDSLDITSNVPSAVMAVSNGRLADSTVMEDRTAYHWTVKNPINNYGVNINIADYANFSDVYEGEKGGLDLNFYVLKSNLSKAKKQFQQVPKMLEAMEYWLGPYPFYKDGYKLVEVPYLGMEHQSSVTYGNGYENGYLGRDLSGSGWGEKFDYIIIHESAHEWFANNVTNRDRADMWIQESFTTYAESLFVDYYYGKKAASEYVLGMRKLVKNDRPIIGTYGVNREGSGDMYFKGTNILNSLRYIMNDDDAWRKLLRNIGEKFYHQTVSSETVENYIAAQTNINLSAFFDQYLRTVRIPQFVYKTDGKILKYRYENTVDNFDYPLDISLNGVKKRLEPTSKWQELANKKRIENIEVDPNFYVNVKSEK